jgi:S1-C subfamily serine protease
VSTVSEWKVPPAVQPRPEDYDFDLEAALSAVVALKATVPEDAFTAEILGTERAGNGVVIRKEGVILTIGYLITEAESIWLTTGDGRVVPATPLGYDQATGFGLVQALARLDLPALPMGDSHAAALGERVVVAGPGGTEGSVAAQIVAKQEFAGYWEYVLDEAIFTVPAHPHWGGSAMIGATGELLGIGSLQLEAAREKGRRQHLNMIVPINELKPILNDLMTLGRPNRPPRPWLGLYATEVDNKIVVAGLATGGPAQQASLRTGDIVVSVAGTPPTSLAGFFRQVWALGDAGVEVPLMLQRAGRTLEARIASVDRNSLLKQPRMQ